MTYISFNSGQIFEIHKLNFSSKQNILGQCATAFTFNSRNNTHNIIAKIAKNVVDIVL